uniref:Neuferricin n=1 Tax=Clastoptera arizonana TaxID=38151 RepID=A0A1B6C9H9_9HEMI
MILRYGRDASRSFVTGDFTEEGLSDDVIDLQYEDLRGLKQWLEFYYKEYVYKGKLAGRYFDSNGLPTLYNHKLTARIEEADKNEENKLQSKLMYPPCNVEWSVEDGSRVWCTTSSGGIDRDWVGVPRKLYLPGQNKYRCACVNLLHSSNTFPADNTLRNGNLEEYTGCHPKSSSCHVGK